MSAITDAIKAAPKLFTAKLELEVAELRSDLAKKERRIAELEEELTRVHEMRFQQGFYFSGSDPFPFCQHCWEASAVRMHLAPPFKHTGGGFGYSCGLCKKVFWSAVILPGTTEPSERPDESPLIAVVSRSSFREELDRW